MKTFLALAVCILLQLSIKAQSAPDYSAYSYETYITSHDTLRYRMLTPAGYDVQKAYPLVIFLHGAGERGSDNAAQLLHGGSLFLKDSVRKQFPAFVIFPQCPKDSTWAPFRLKRDSSGQVTDIFFSDTRDAGTTPGRLVKSLLDSLLKTGRIDSKRVYLGGLSLGGMGTFDLLARYPDTWAAAFPICGMGNVKNASRFQKVPLWIFHGAADNVVPVSGSKNYYDALKGKNPDLKYSEYPGVGHNSWDNAFAEPELLPWLFSHRKK